MLQSLRVKNLAIADNVAVEFDRGLNAITGETGAGKSILVGALNLVLGARADRTLIRSGEDACTVEAVFELPDPSDIDALLEELGIATCDHGQLIVRRILAGNGTNKVLVNDCPSTVQALKRLGDLLVDLHGPYDHQSLLDADFQRNILDSFGHTWQARAAYEEAYDAWRGLLRQREALEGDDEDIEREIDMLRFTVDEIERAELAEGEDETVQQEHTLVANAQQILVQADGICQALMDSEHAAFDALTSARQMLGELRRTLDEAATWEQDVESTCIQVQELVKSIQSRVQGIEADPERLQWLDDRMALIHKLKRKYGGSLDAIEDHRAHSRSRLDNLESREERIEEINATIEAARSHLVTKGKALSKLRTAAAQELAGAITAELKDLGFPHGGFEVNVEPTDPGPSGMDQVEFGFAPNMGEAMRPLRLIASSGEISRVMLATKRILASHDKVPVLVFDEIDANVGGEMGTAIGRKLAEVAEHHQVLCITHLPQVAVYGHQHFRVFKTVEDGRTHTRLQAVDDEARTEEIARMLGGRDMTNVTLDHAREMLKQVATD